MNSCREVPNLESYQARLYPHNCHGQLTSVDVPHFASLNGAVVRHKSPFVVEKGLAPNTYLNTNSVIYYVEKPQ